MKPTCIGVSMRHGIQSIDTLTEICGSQWEDRVRQMWLRTGEADDDSSELVLSLIRWLYSDDRSQRSRLLAAVWVMWREPMAMEEWARSHGVYSSELKRALASMPEIPRMRTNLAKAYQAGYRMARRKANSAVRAISTGGES